MWIAAICPYFNVQGALYTTTWSDVLTITGFAASMTVNALVTGLIVFRIFKVFRAVKALGITSGKKLCSIIFIIIESGTALFAIQLARVVIATTVTGLGKNAKVDIYQIIIVTHEMLNVVISSVIVAWYSTDNVAARV